MRHKREDFERENRLQCTARANQSDSSTCVQRDVSRLDQCTMSTAGHGDRARYVQLQGRSRCETGKAVPRQESLSRCETGKAVPRQESLSRCETGKAVPRQESLSRGRQMGGQPHSSNHSHPAGDTAQTKRQSRRSGYDQCWGSSTIGERRLPHAQGSQPTAWPADLYPGQFQGGSVDVRQTQPSAHSLLMGLGSKSMNLPDGFSCNELYDNYHQNQYYNHGQNEMGNFQNKVLPCELSRRSLSQGFLPDQSRQYSQNARLCMDQSELGRRPVAMQGMFSGLNTCSRRQSNIQSYGSIPVIGNQIRSLRFDTMELQYMTEPHTNQVINTIPYCGDYVGTQSTYFGTENYNTAYPNYGEPVGGGYTPCDLRFVPSAAQQFEADSCCETSVGSQHQGCNTGPLNKQPAEENMIQAGGNMHDVLGREAQQNPHWVELEFGSNKEGYTNNSTSFNTAVLPDARECYQTLPSDLVYSGDSLLRYNRRKSFLNRQSNLAGERSVVNKPSIETVESTLPSRGPSRSQPAVPPRPLPTVPPRPLPAVPPPPLPPHILLQRHKEYQEHSEKPAHTTRTSCNQIHDNQWSKKHKASEKLPAKCKQDASKFFNSSIERPSSKSSVESGDHRHISPTEVLKPQRRSFPMPKMRKTLTGSRQQSDKCVPNILRRSKSVPKQRFRPWTVYSSDLLTRPNSNAEVISDEQKTHHDMIKDTVCETARPNSSTESSSQGLYSAVVFSEADSSTAEQGTPSKLNNQRSDTVYKTNAQDQNTSKDSKMALVEDKNKELEITKECRSDSLDDTRKLTCSDNEKLTEQSYRCISGGNKDNNQVKRLSEENHVAIQDANPNEDVEGATLAKPEVQTNTLSKGSAGENTNTNRTDDVKASFPLKKILPHFSKSKKPMVNKKCETKNTGKHKETVTRKVNSISVQENGHYGARSSYNQKRNTAKVCLFPQDKIDLTLKGNAKGNAKTAIKPGSKSTDLEAKHQHMLSNQSECLKPDIDTRLSSLSKVACPNITTSSRSLPDIARPNISLIASTENKTLKELEVTIRKRSRSVDSLLDTASPVAAVGKESVDDEQGTAGLDKIMDNRLNYRQRHLEQQHFYKLGRNTNKKLPKVTRTSSNIKPIISSKVTSNHMKKDIHFEDKSSQEKLPNATEHLSMRVTDAKEKRTVVLPLKMRHKYKIVNLNTNSVPQKNDPVRKEKAVSVKPSKLRNLDKSGKKTKNASSSKTQKKQSKSQTSTLSAEENLASERNVEKKTICRRREIHKRMWSITRGKYELSSPTTYIVKPVKPLDASKTCNDGNDKRFQQACAMAKELLLSRKHAPKAHRNDTARAKISIEDLNTAETMSQIELGNKPDFSRAVAFSKNVSRKEDCERKQRYSQDEANSDMIITDDQIKTSVDTHDSSDLNSNFEFYSSILEQNFGITKRVSQVLCEETDSLEMYRQYVNAKIDLSQTDRQPLENVYPPLLVSSARMPVSGILAELTSNGGCRMSPAVTHTSSTVPCLYDQGGLMSARVSSTVPYCYPDVGIAAGEQDASMQPDLGYHRFSPNIPRADTCDREMTDMCTYNDLPLQLTAVPLDNTCTDKSGVFGNELDLELDTVDLATRCTDTGRTDCVDLDQYANDVAHYRNVFDDALTDLMDDNTFSFKSNEVVGQSKAQTDACKGTTESQTRDSNDSLTAYQVRIRSERRKRYQKHFPKPLPKARTDKAASAERWLYKDAQDFLSNFDASNRRSSSKTKDKSETNVTDLNKDNAATVRNTKHSESSNCGNDIGKEKQCKQDIEQKESSGAKKRIKDQKPSGMCKKQKVDRSSKVSPCNRQKAETDTIKFEGKTEEKDCEESKFYCLEKRIPLLRIKSEKTGLKVVKSKKSKGKCRENMSGHFNAVTKRLKQHALEAKAAQTKSRSTSTMVNQDELSDASRKEVISAKNQPVEVGPWKCMVCKAVFEREAQLRHHGRSVHKDWCWKCKIKLPNSVARIQHVKRGHTIKMYCRLCSIWCCSKSGYTKHLASKTHRRKEAIKQARLMAAKTPGKSMSKTTGNTIGKTTGKTTRDKSQLPIVKMGQERDVNNNHMPKTYSANKICNRSRDNKEERDGRRSVAVKKMTVKKEKVAQYCTTCDHFYTKFTSHLKTNKHKNRSRSMKDGKSEAQTQSSPANVNSNLVDSYPEVKPTDPQPSMDVKLPPIGCNPVLLIKNVANTKWASPCSPQYDNKYRYKQQSGTPCSSNDVCVIEMLDVTPKKDPGSADCGTQADRDDTCVLATLQPGSSMSKPESPMSNLNKLKKIRADFYYKQMMEGKARHASSKDEEYTECVLKQDPLIVVSSDSELM